ncbi:carbon-phosphorus lyase complex subunit PhnI [Varunaivibrio sulfuroxidans]|uniref:Alpha-D-ribose 1-methylphosphonate 5-triphosphate synthase subunit PhnI n=1 Tax=Varunaivibrio sulfuroxidans TaxID=1773489 RepID=A0A4R3JE12_9PROT|nr:carbon-phosphorus lyase complex subunit PhnI [Varunaivibrio sulfuroxidans]TCS64288.1 alpha-D-ribose 1-methylphosphonate 5-triphosphate synthase subunit PhnI [Varunaivibrio sulfuroxidans]WES31274.1 carbon-phosphorus lyase complex subunit PhnI [Varunaivibrio sulfuroxidans]
MYVAVKGGERAIDSAHALLDEQRRGDPAVAEISPTQISEQMGLAVDRVMSEGALYDRDLAALALKQACGDQVEAIFLLRAFRTTLARFAASTPIDSAAMNTRRRISATYKDLPGGQMLGPTFDYTHRLLDFTLAETPGAARSERRAKSERPVTADYPVADDGDELPVLPRVSEFLSREGLLQDEVAEDDQPVGDITRDPIAFPAERDVRLQALARADEGFLLGLGYSTQRGYGRNHPFAGEIRLGDVAVEIVPEELGFAIEIGDITVSECEMVNQFTGSAQAPAQFTRGYGLAFGYCERKVMAMALVDRALRARELGEEVTAPAQDDEFVLSHSDNVEASGFVQHLKLPHYVDFQGELETVRKLRADADKARHGDDKQCDNPVSDTPKETAS